MPYAIEIRGSVRTSGQDDFWCGWEAATLADAQTELREWQAGNVGQRVYGPGDHVIGPDGAVLHYAVKPGKHRAEEDLDGSEFAMQQGMAFGIDAYNEAIGF